MASGITLRVLQNFVIQQDVSDQGRGQPLTGLQFNYPKNGCCLGESDLEFPGPGGLAILISLLSVSNFRVHKTHFLSTYEAEQALDVQSK